MKQPQKTLSQIFERFLMSWSLLMFDINWMILSLTRNLSGIDVLENI